MQEQWLLSLPDQCQAQKVAFFFKQWGGVRKSKAGRQLQGRTYDERPTTERAKPSPIRIRLDLVDTVTSWKHSPSFTE